MAAGCDLFIAKPCLPGDLAAELRQLVRRRTQRARIAKVPVDRRAPVSRTIPAPDQTVIAGGLIVRLTSLAPAPGAG